jgi:hypothetical protein
VTIDVENRYNSDYGSNVKINCNQRVKPSKELDNSLYSLDWLRLNDKIAPNTHVIENSLIIYNVSKENLGEYVCLLTNRAGRNF